jgi:hypothetical protein
LVERPGSPVFRRFVASPDIAKHTFRVQAQTFGRPDLNGLRRPELLPVFVSSVVNLPVNLLAAENPLMPATIFPELLIERRPLFLFRLRTHNG